MVTCMQRMQTAVASWVQAWCKKDLHACGLVGMTQPRGFHGSPRNSTGCGKAQAQVTHFCERAVLVARKDLEPAECRLARCSGGKQA
jgi:hypothetical protein